MKTLTELARESRMRAQIETQMSTLIRATALEKAAIEAADRLDAIDKAWDAFIVNEGVSWKISPTGCMTFGDLRRAIEGRGGKE